ncbi:MAG: ABC transporter permease subunit [Saprospiraceae bacterium]|nr:ABC transporter permease subunit [Saprospiraceae bacterium]
MLKYLLRRTILALPTLLVISFLAFGLGKCAPGDPVVNVFGEENYNTLDPAQQAVVYRSHAVQLGLDGPEFYFSLTTAVYPDTLWRIFPLDRRERLEKLIGQTGNWPAVKNYDAAISKTARAIEALPSSLPQSSRLRNELTFLIRADKLALVDSALSGLNAIVKEIPEATFSGSTPRIVSTEFHKPIAQFPELSRALIHLDSAAYILHTQKLSDRLLNPALHWHGFDNQYHGWLKGFLTGDLGLTRRRVEVWVDLQSSLLSTLTINFLALLLAYLIAVPLGVEMARRKGRFLDRWGKRSLFFLYSMPVFWLGGLLIMIFTNTSWGHAMLPSVYFDVQDAWQPGKTSFGDWWTANAAKCVLPIIILTLHAVAILALQMRNGVLSAIGEDYIRTARAKGVPEEEVYWSHAFRNALFPIITVFASVLPAMITGSLVVEALFGFPGMGNKTFEAYLGKDLPLLSAIMMVAATLTIVGSLLADVLYTWADPRIRFSKENG